MRVSPKQFTTDGQKIAALAKMRGAHPVLVEAGGAPEAPELIIDDESRRMTHEVDWREFTQAVKKLHMGLLYGGDVPGLMLVREDDLPLPGLPDIQA